MSLRAVATSLFLALSIPAQATAALHFFTNDGTAGGTPLLPGFLLDSCWSALGTSRSGDIYVAVSNHLQPGGNVALFKFNPAVAQMSLLGDLTTTSTAANNWMPNESQYKVHSFLLRDGIGNLWFASDDHPPTPFLRGAHLYSIDTATDAITDRSATQPNLLLRDFRVRPNPGTAAVQSGVFVEYYGLKGIYLNPRAPHLLYAITYPDGFVLQYERDTERMHRVGQAKEGAFVFYVDNRGNAYYEQEENGQLSIVRFDAAARTTTTLATMTGFEVGAIAPTQDGEVVYWLESQSKTIWRHDCRTGSFQQIATACGSNWWRLYNLALSPNGEALYYVSNNNAHSTIRRIDLVTGACTQALDVDALLGSRNLCFGGVNVWDRNGSFYAPVWTFQAPNGPDIGLLQVTVGEAALTGTPGTLSVTTGGQQSLSLRAGPDNGSRVYLLLGSATGTTGGPILNDLELPLTPDTYFWQTLASPNSAPLSASLGVLDADGRAQASYTLAPGSSALLGMQQFHAFAVIDQDGVIAFTSNAAALTFVP